MNLPIKQGLSTIRKEGFSKAFLYFFELIKEGIEEVFTSFKKPKCISIDLGSSQIKYALFQKNKNLLQTLSWGVLNLKEEALLNTEEVDNQLTKIISELGEYPLVLTIPQNLVNSQTINLPEDVDEVFPEEVRDYFKNVATGGMQNSGFQIAYKKVIPPASKSIFTNPYFVSFCKLQSINELIGRFIKTPAPIINILPTLNATASSFLKENFFNLPESVVIVDIGAISTHALILYHGNFTLAANFPIGGEYLTEHLSKALRCSFEEAEELKKTNNSLTGQRVNAIFQGAVRHWLKDLINWFMELARATASIRGIEYSEDAFYTEMRSKTMIYLCGGTSLTPGFIDYLCEKSGIKFLPWPRHTNIKIPEEMPSERFAACIGAALETLNIMPDSGNLTPENILRSNQISRTRLKFMIVSLLLIPLILFFFLCTNVNTLIHISQKREKIIEQQTTIENARKIINLYQTRDQDILNYSPILRMHKRTVDLLNTIKSQQSLVNTNTNQIWFLLLADKHTYNLGNPTPNIQTNEITDMGDEEDISLGKYTYITELCQLTNSNPKSLEENFFSSFHSNLTNLFFISYSDTLLESHFKTNFFDPKYLVGGIHRGIIFTTDEALSPLRSIISTNILTTQTNKAVVKISSNSETAK